MVKAESHDGESFFDHIFDSGFRWPRWGSIFPTILTSADASQSTGNSSVCGPLSWHLATSQPVALSAPAIILPYRRVTGKLMWLARRTSQPTKKPSLAPSQNAIVNTGSWDMLLQPVSQENGVGCSCQHGRNLHCQHGRNLQKLLLVCFVYRDGPDPALL